MRRDHAFFYRLHTVLRSVPMQNRLFTNQFVRTHEIQDGLLSVRRQIGHLGTSRNKVMDAREFAGRWSNRRFVLNLSNRGLLHQLFDLFVIQTRENTAALKLSM